MKIEIGKRIPEEICEVVNKLVTTDDLHEVAENHPLSYSTLLSLTYRKGQVTIDNHTMIDGLIKKAKDNVEKQINFLNRIKPDLDVMQNSYNLFHEKLTKQQIDE